MGFIQTKSEEKLIRIKSLLSRSINDLGPTLQNNPCLIKGKYKRQEAYLALNFSSVKYQRLTNNQPTRP